jgi:hypothetical protein
VEVPHAVQHFLGKWPQLRIAEKEISGFHFAAGQEPLALLG